MSLGLVSSDLYAAVLGLVVASIVGSTVLVRQVGACPRAGLATGAP